MDLQMEAASAASRVGSMDVLDCFVSSNADLVSPPLVVRVKHPERKYSLPRPRIQVNPSFLPNGFARLSEVANPLATGGRTVSRITYRWTGPICIALPPTEH